jgi:DNA topoisomerase-1
MPKPMTPEEQTRRKKKTESVRKLAQQISTLRRKLSKDMKSKDEKTRLTALAVAIIDKTAERVGNAASAKEGHVGVTGFKNNQMTISGNTINFKYTGKSGVSQDKTFTDGLIAKLLKECQGNCKGKNSPVLVTSDGLQVNAAKVNRYLKEFGVTAKDIRGYASNTLVYNMLKNSKTPSDPDERKKQFKGILKAVAEKVGHQQATLKQHYLLPGVEEAYIKNGTVKKVKNASRLAAIAEAVENDECVRLLNAFCRRFVPRLEQAYEEIVGPLPKWQGVKLQVNDWDLPDGKVGSYKFPDDGCFTGILTVSPETFDSKKWQYVAAHELIHAMLGPDEEPHGELFDKLASIVGIPVKYWD